MLAPETILQGRYRIVRELGQGGMGAVYEAVDRRLDKTVALKETLFTEERLRKQFEREARLLAGLHHPALPAVSDHFAEGDGEFLVMQYIAGDDLSAMLAQRQGPFPPNQALAWADQLLDALDYLHTQDPQIIHRDIKPQNLKLTARGQIILLDFGLAKGQAAGLSRATTTASIFGYTPNYAPLEQVQGLGTDARSDLYALAATLYHLLTGLKPPDALTRAAAIVNSQPDPLKSANEVNPAVDSHVAAVLQRAMSQNREQRYASAAEMRKALQGGSKAATVTNSAEAATVLFPSGATTIPIASPTQKVTTALTGETTVISGSAGPAKRRISPWASAAAAVILLGAGFGAFYAYQHRSGATQVSAPGVQPSSATVPSVSPSATASPADNKATADAGRETANKSEPRKQRAASDEAAAKAKQKAAKDKESSAKKGTNATSIPQVPVPKPPTGGNASDAKNAAAPPPERNAPNDNPASRRRTGTFTRPDGAVVRTLPDGTQLVTRADGTRVIIRPDGTRQILSRPGGPGGQRRNRRP
jgi:eukaryotic-like serine/threonine-protein kinase